MLVNFPTTTDPSAAPHVLHPAPNYSCSVGPLQKACNPTRVQILANQAAGRPPAPRSRVGAEGPNPLFPRATPTPIGVPVRRGAPGWWVWPVVGVRNLWPRWVGPDVGLRVGLALPTAQSRTCGAALLGFLDQSWRRGACIPCRGSWDLLGRRAEWRR